MNFFKDKKILITGGAGYLAFNIVNLLKNVECHITRLDRPGASFAPIMGVARVEDIYADIRDHVDWNAMLMDVDIVFHFAAQTSVYVANENPHADLAINVLPMLHMLDACRQNKYHPTMLFSGTVTEVGLPLRLPVDESHPNNPITVYDMHKLMAEYYLKHFIDDGILLGSVLRLANVYGPGPRSGSADRGVLNMMVSRALNGNELTVYGDGCFIRDYIYVEDVASAFLRAAVNIDMTSGKYFVIGSGNGHTITDAINLVASRVEHKTGRIAKVVHVEPPAMLSPIEQRNFVANTGRFTEATDWHAKVSLLEGIDRTIDFYLDNAI